MGRPVYPYELGDADFSWLINTFQESNPNFSLIQTSGVPLSFIDTGHTAVCEGSDTEPPAVAGDRLPAEQLDAIDGVLEKN